MVLPMLILQLCRVGAESKSSMILRDNSPRGRVCLEFILRLRSSTTELDLGARSVGRFKQSLRLPPDATPKAMRRMVSDVPQ